MGMSTILANMPDLWLRVLDEHIPDQQQLCVACRDERNIAAAWPCMTHRVAADARAIYRSGR